MNIELLQSRRTRVKEKDVLLKDKTSLIS